MNACDVTPWFAEFVAPWVCSDAVWDMQHAHDMINHFTTAFLLSKLNDDAEAGAALSPEEMDFPGIDLPGGRAIGSSVLTRPRRWKTVPGSVITVKGVCFERLAGQPISASRP